MFLQLTQNQLNVINNGIALYQPDTSEMRYYVNTLTDKMRRIKQNLLWRITKDDGFSLKIILKVMQDNFFDALTEEGHKNIDTLLLKLQNT